MDEKYRLVFRGEVLEGQHRAVVQRRLKLAFEYSAGQLEKLFSGSAVVLKQSVDKETAASYQAIFKKAGGRLMVFEEKDDPQAVARKPGRTLPDSPTPVPEEAPLDIDVDTLLAEFATAEELRARIEAPDFSLAQVGAVLVDVTEEEVFEVPEADVESEAEIDVVVEKRAGVVAASGFGREIIRLARVLSEVVPLMDTAVDLVAKDDLPLVRLDADTAVHQTGIREHQRRLNRTPNRRHSPHQHEPAHPNPPPKQLQPSDPPHPIKLAHPTSTQISPTQTPPI